jgi:hypothetical protein
MYFSLSPQLQLLCSPFFCRFIKITKDVSYISKKAKGQADLISEDISELRENVKEQGLKLKHFTGFFNKLRKKK